MATGRYFIKTWGCQMNEQDGQKMAVLLEAAGYEAAAGLADADVILLNTCSVRAQSADKLFGALGRLRRLKRERPEVLIGVTGCVAQQEGEGILRRAPHADLVLGTRRIGRLPALLDGARRGERPVDTSLDDLGSIFWDGGAAARPGGRAYLTIMEGCNMGCSFCVVPFTRGREQHRPFADIVAEAERRVGEGVAQLELLGQTVNAWRDGDRYFPDLLRRVGAIPGLRRLRFTSSHPAYVGARLAAAVAETPAVCPHLHLPVQSGSDRILAAMGRGYTGDQYRRRVDLLRRRLPDLAVSSDVIVGYPGESEADFADTMRLLEEVRFSQVFAFKYSPRPRTSARSLEDDVPEDVKGRRLNELFALQDTLTRGQNAALVGTRREVLCDGPSRLDPAVASGRTPCNRVVNVRGPRPEVVAGRILDVLITVAGPHSLGGVPVGAAA